MHIPKKYFHDRLILVLISTGTFLAVLGAVLIPLRLDTANTTGHIVEYRTNLGIDRFEVGSATDLIAFGVFNVVVIIIHTLLSMRLYHLRRHLSIAVMGLAVLLVVLSIIVSNALLVLS